MRGPAHQNTITMNTPPAKTASAGISPLPLVFPLSANQNKILEKDGYELARLQSRRPFEDEVILAAELVKRCNSHHALVDALRAIFPLAQRGCAFPADTVVNKKTLENAQALLASLEPKA